MGREGVRLRVCCPIDRSQREKHPLLMPRRRGWRNGAYSVSKVKTLQGTKCTLDSEAGISGNRGYEVTEMRSTFKDFPGGTGMHMRGESSGQDANGSSADMQYSEIGAERRFTWARMRGSASAGPR